MKLVPAIAIAVILLMVVAPVALAADSGPGVTVYVSVSVDGELLVAAQPVTITDMTAQGAIKAAHTEFYSGGESGYTAGIDPMFNMYLVTQCWGVTATPFIIINGAPLGADLSIPPTVDAAPVKANDNIIICTSSDPMNKPATPVALKSTLEGDSATVTATAWTLDFMTFTYSSAPFANANVIDPATGASLGTTDGSGAITVTVPESGVVAIDGLAAINVKAIPAPAAPVSASPVAAAPGSSAAAPASAEFPLFYGPTNSLIIIAIIILTPIAIVVIVKMVRQSRLDKVTAVPLSAFAAPTSALNAPPPAPGAPAPAAAPIPVAAGPGKTVYVSVSVDGKLMVAARPVTVTDMTVQGAIKAAHTAYYSGGESGYKAGIDPAFNMCLISRCWGVQATPFVIINGAPLGAEQGVPPTVDAAPIKANDNIIISISSDPMNRPAKPVSLSKTLSGGSATVTAIAWTLDLTTFTYSSAPLAGAKVIDPATGASLGTTDAKGSITVTVPESGVIAIEGLAAIAVTPGNKQ